VRGMNVHPQNRDRKGAARQCESSPQCHNMRLRNPAACLSGFLGWKTGIMARLCVIPAMSELRSGANETHWSAASFRSRLCGCTFITPHPHSTPFITLHHQSAPFIPLHNPGHFLSFPFTG
jgi:hypothetical protein